jgi:hypothetical protein
MIFLQLRFCSESWEEGGESLETRRPRRPRRQGRSLLRGEHVDLTLRYFLVLVVLLLLFFQDAFFDFDFLHGLEALWS